MALLFEDAAKAKDAIMVSQQKEIQMLYLDWAEDIADKAEFYSHKTNASAALSERYYKELYNHMKATNKQLGQEIKGLITSNMYTIADSVVASNVNWLKEFGFSEDGLNAAFSYIPNDVVQRLITGQIYQGGWNLSQRIWSDSQQTQKDIYQIMARGLAEQKSVYEIAKDLESYVRPGAKKNWNPILAMKNTKTGEIEYKRIYKKQVDYNAQRLARTLAQHSYQQSFIATTQKNPFITEYIWHSNGSRVCELCLARDGVHFKKNELPMDHPNGMCVMEPAIAEDMIDQLADWFNSPDGTYPEIDEFAGNFGYEAAKGGTVSDYINKYGVSTKNPSAWYHSMSPIQKAEAKLLKDAEGLGWDEWYEKYIYSGNPSDLEAYKAKVAAKTTVKSKTIPIFNEAQDRYLSPYGFTPDNMPVDFDDWSHKVSHSHASDILKSMGTSWGDPHPYQQLKKYYDANLVSSNLGSKTVKVAKATASTDPIEVFTKNNATKIESVMDWIGSLTPSQKAEAKIIKEQFGVTWTELHGKVYTPAVKSADSMIDTAKWYDNIKKNDLNEMDKWTNDWLKTISNDERNGVVKYTSSAYRDMNNYLRGFKESTKYPTELNACKSALSKASLPKDVIVRRGSDYNMIKDLGFENIAPQNKDKIIGSIVEDKAFISTSPASGGGFSGSIEYVIKVPKGSQAMYIDSISHYQGEQELLINCGGKYSIEDIEFNGYGDVNKIYMTLRNLQ